MLDELMAHEYTIPLELIVKCKELIELEKEQIIEAYKADIYPCSDEDAEQYYTSTYES
jgi:hypothetical protein